MFLDGSSHLNNWLLKCSLLDTDPELDAGTSLDLFTFQPYRESVLPATIDLIIDETMSLTGDIHEPASLFQEPVTNNERQNLCSPVPVQVRAFIFSPFMRRPFEWIPGYLLRLS